MRLHRFLSKCGVASRRKSEELILDGQIEVNGEQVTELGTKIDPLVDVVTYKGSRVTPAVKVTYVLYKPKGIVTTLHDPEGRPTVADFLPPSSGAVRPVGRLDRDSEGLLLLTSDGDLAMRLTHPKYNIEKEYEAIVSGFPDEKKLARLSKGILLEGKKTAPAMFELVGRNSKKSTSSLRIIIHEGRKRQIRMMCLALGHPVIKLRRVRIGFLTLKGLQPGEMKLLGQKELSRLMEAVGLKGN